MAETTNIEWADMTWNPWIGCTKVSPGCLHCYAENTTRARVLRSQGKETWGKGKPRARTSEAYWKQPLRWDKESRQAMDSWEVDHASGSVCPSRVFPSLCDWLDEEVPIEWLADFLKLIHDTPNLDWLLLTKRPENFESRLQAAWDYRNERDTSITDGFRHRISEWLDGKAWDNVWVGTSVEDQIRADERIPQLLKIPATVKFLSVEPLLGAIDFTRLDIDEKCQDGHRITADVFAATANCACCVEGDEAIAWPKIDWVIVGGESGKDARPCNVEWSRGIIEECAAAGVPCFNKQLGSHVLTDEVGEFPVDTDFDFNCVSRALLKHRKGGDPSEWPADLRVRQFPEVRR